MAEDAKTTAPYQSFASRRILAERGGIPFTMRLARVMLPRLQAGSVALDVDGQFLYTTKTANPDSKNLGHEFVQKHSMGVFSGFKGRAYEEGDDLPKDSSDAMKGPITKIKEAYNQAYGSNTTSTLIELSPADFRSSQIQSADKNKRQTDWIGEDDEEKRYNSWNNLYALLDDGLNDKNSFKDLNLSGTQMENVAAKLNDQAQKEFARLNNKGISAKELRDNKEILTIVRFDKFPVSRYNNYFDYGSNLNKLLEGGDRAATRKLEMALKQRSVELLKVMANSIDTRDDVDGQKTIVSNEVEDRVDGKPVSKKIPSYKINAGTTAEEGGKSNPQYIRFWQSYEGEIPLKEGRDAWKMAIFEWEPMVVMKNDEIFWGNAMPGPQMKESFMQSRLNNIRFYVAVAYMLDENKVQQYYAWAPERVDRMKGYFVNFHNAVKGDRLSDMEPHRVDSFDIRSGFTTPKSKVNKMLMDVVPIRYDIFNRYEPDSGMIQQLLRKPLPVSATGRNSIELDLGALDERGYSLLKNLPTLEQGVVGINPSTSNMWAFTKEGIKNTEPLLDIDANTLAAPDGEDSKVRNRMSKLVTSTSNFTQKFIVSPMVNRALIQIRTKMGNKKLSEILDRPEEVRDIQRSFADMFRPAGNLYLQYVFGNVLNNALTEEMIGSSKTTKDVVLAYRSIAQNLLDMIALAHSLGRQEAIHVFHVDVINRLIKIAQTLDDTKTEEVLKQAAFAALVAHPVIGMSLEDKRRSFKTMRANVEILRRGASDSAGTDATVSTTFPGSTTEGVERADDADHNATDARSRAKSREMFENFAYWAFVLLDNEYWERHTKGIDKLQDTTTDEEIRKKKQFLQGMTKDRAREFEIEEQEPKLFGVVSRDKDQKETYEQLEKSLPQTQKEGGVPRVKTENIDRDGRLQELGLRN